MSTGHTPTPWRVSNLDGLEVTTSAPGILEGSKRICETSNSLKPLEEAQANAAFIVRACNRDHLFDEMVKALKLALLGIEVAAEKAQEYEDDSWIADIFAHQTISAVIAKAEATC